MEIVSQQPLLKLPFNSKHCQKSKNWICLLLSETLRSPSCEVLQMPEIGHLAEGCNSPRRCLLCAGPHEPPVCTSVKKLCANCGGSHQANSLECPYIIKAMAIEKLHASGLSYAQAAKQITCATQLLVSKLQVRL
jgi:hypothetical protein